MSFSNKLLLALCAVVTLMGCNHNTLYSYDLVVLYEAESDLSLTPSNNARLVSFSVVNQSDQRIELRSIPILIESIDGDHVLSNVIADIKLRRNNGAVVMGPIQIPAGTSDQFEMRLEDPLFLLPGEAILLHLEADIIATQDAAIRVTIGADGDALSDTFFSSDPMGILPTTSVHEPVTRLVMVSVQ